MLWRSLVLMTIGCAACITPRGAEPQPRAAEPQTGCSLRIIASLARAPDDALLADLTRVSNARVTLVRAMPADLYLMELAAQGASDACTRALERLKSDARVRSADIDERRGIAQ